MTTEPKTTFADLGLDPAILTTLEQMGFKNPLPIQAEAIPLILQKRDLISLAQTGSGKTAACAIPLCNSVDTNRRDIQALVIVPTRELAVQYAMEAQKIGKLKGVKAFAIYGGEDASMQQAKLKHGVQVLIATPGRLIDFIYSRSIDLSQVETLVLDEADEMLGMGFYDDLEFIMQCLVQEHQTLLFSATMPPEIKKIAVRHMKDPLEITLTQEHASPQTIEHHFHYCKHYRRDDALLSLIQEAQPKQAIVFCQSRYQCENVSHFLGKHLDALEYIHAGLPQGQRMSITNKFRTGKIRFLVATDVAARGLDFSEVSHVFIYHLSENIDAYIHRSGRTGRREREGMVITLITDRDLISLSRVLKRIQRPPLWIGEPPPPRASRR